MGSKRAFRVGDIVSYVGKFHQDTGPIVEIRGGYIYIENGPGSKVGIPPAMHHKIITESE